MKERENKLKKKKKKKKKLAPDLKAWDHFFWQIISDLQRSKIPEDTDKGLQGLWQKWMPSSFPHDW